MQVPPFKKVLLDTMPYIDILFGNEHEAAAFAEAEALGTTDLSEIALKVGACCAGRPWQPGSLAAPVGWGQSACLHQVPWGRPAFACPGCTCPQSLSLHAHLPSPGHDQQLTTMHALTLPPPPRPRRSPPCPSRAAAAAGWWSSPRARTPPSWPRTAR
jgi:hypothetical protein